MLKSPSLRHRKTGWRQGATCPRAVEHLGPILAGCGEGFHRFTPAQGLPLARAAPRTESVAALPVVLRGANGAAAPRELSLPLPNLYRRGNRLRSVAC